MVPGHLGKHLPSEPWFSGRAQLTHSNIMFDCRRDGNSPACGPQPQPAYLLGWGWGWGWDWDRNRCLVLQGAAKCLSPPCKSFDPLHLSRTLDSQSQSLSASALHLPCSSLWTDPWLSRRPRGQHRPGLPGSSGRSDPCSGTGTSTSTGLFASAPSWTLASSEAIPRSQSEAAGDIACSLELSEASDRWPPPNHAGSRVPTTGPEPRQRQRAASSEQHQKHSRRQLASRLHGKRRLPSRDTCLSALLLTIHTTPGLPGRAWLCGWLEMRVAFQGARQTSFWTATHCSSRHSIVTA